MIEAHSRGARHFTADDAEFLQGVAGVLGAAGERAGHEDLMRDSEAQFRELADTTPALMWMTDAEGDVTFVNEGWLRFTGGHARRRRDVRGERPPGRPRGGGPALERGIGPREEFRCEYRLRHAASGGYRWVLELGTPRFSGGEFVGYVGTATDIHERRTMEEALRESEASFRELADTAPAMMWTTDTDGADHVREPGLAALHRHDLPGGDGRRAGRSACTPTTPRRCWRAGRRRSPSGAPGRASTG